MDRPEASLQFEKAEPVVAPTDGGARAGEVRCAACGTPLRSYHQVNGQVACESCKNKLVAMRRASHVPTLLRATVLGVLAAIAGALLYHGIAKLTGYEIGLVSIAVGLLVGLAVRRGSRGRGGWRYQALAVFLCYAGISAAYAPSFFEAIAKHEKETSSSKATQGTAPVVPGSEPSTAPGAPTDDGHARVAAPPGLGKLLLGVGLLFLICLALPVVIGIQSPMTFVIVGIALWEAWRVNRAAPFQVSGPFEVAPAPAQVTANG